MKTITMYELLGLVKDDKAPKKIKVYGKVYINNNCNCYLDEKDKSLCTNVEIPMFLNDIVEILEDKKIPEKLVIGVTEFDEIHINNEISTERQVREVANKINEIIDYLKSKGE